MWIGQQKKPVEKTPETVQVPVPIQTIPAQTDLMPEMFKKVTMQKAQVAANVVVNERDLVGRINRTELVMDKPVTAEQIAVRSNELGLAYTINRGQRAMSVALDIVGAVCDFVQPGNRVDVVATFQREGKVVVRTLVQDVLVIAAGTALNPPAPAAAVTTTGALPAAKVDPNPPKRPDMPFTLAVTPEQAQIIIAADVTGDLRLVLRRMGDHSVVPLPTANSWTLIGPLPEDKKGGGPAAPAKGPEGPPTTPAAAARTAASLANAFGATPAAPPPVAPAKPAVEIIRGSQREIVTPQ